MYKGKVEVLCAFCRQSNNDIKSIKELGPFFGPFLYQKKKYYYYYIKTLKIILFLKFIRPFIVCNMDS